MEIILVARLAKGRTGLVGVGSLQGSLSLQTSFSVKEGMVLVKRNLQKML
jgi:hypothetical protein